MKQTLICSVSRALLFVSDLGQTFDRQARPSPIIGRPVWCRIALQVHVVLLTRSLAWIARSQLTLWVPVASMCEGLAPFGMP